MSTLGMPIPLSEIESVLAWVDGFKLSRPTKKISRDFSDAVLLAEILAVHYPKLVEMHNYPPRNSHSLKLNNWMTLNRKVLKKLKLNLCCDTMEQLANCAPGIVERVLVMVREKIRRDEEANRGKDEQNVSSGGSYYEACGDDEHVLVVPVKARVNGVLETIQQKVVNYEAYLALKEELKDAKDTADVLKQKVEHLDSLLKLKEERIDELQKQLERKQVRRREAEALINSLSVPFETVPSPTPIAIDPVHSHKSEHSLHPIKNDIIVIPNKNDSTYIEKEHTNKIEINTTVKNDIETNHVAKVKSRESIKSPKVEESKIPIKHDSSIKPINKASYTKDLDNLDRINSNVFQEIEIVDDRPIAHDDEFEDSEQNLVITIEDTIQNEINSIHNPMIFTQDRDSQKNLKAFVLNNLNND